MSLDLLVTEREVYSVLDWIGDLGGLFDGLKLICVGILSIFNYNLYSAYMVSQLFKEKKSTNPTPDND